MENSNNFNVSSTSIDETIGTARIVIDGYIPAPQECDDPIVELFRAVRHKYADEVFCSIIADHKKDRVICDIIASNRRGREIEDFIDATVNALKGGITKNDGTTTKGIIKEYIELLEKFFEEEDGLKAYIKNIEKAEELGNGKATTLYLKIDADIKEFAEGHNFKMPSTKAIKKEILKNLKKK